MFGNSELKETQRKLEKALNLLARHILTLDPATRSLYLKHYKRLIEARYIYDKSTFQPPFSSDEKESADLLEIIVSRVEEEIKKEKFEGENYIEDFSVFKKGDDTYEDDYLIYKKITKVVKSFFPAIEAATNGKKVEKQLTKKKAKAKFGDPNYPIDIWAFSQSLFLHLRSRGVALVDQGYPFTHATNSSIAMIISHVTPDDFIIENESATSNRSPELFLKFKKEITDLKGHIKWMDANIDDNFDELRIGDSENDYYRTKQDFINDIDPNEVMNIISIAWDDCTDKAKMKKIRACEKEIKGLMSLGESKENTIEIVNIIREFQFFYKTNF